jgi:hypothetical protein
MTREMVKEPVSVLLPGLLTFRARLCIVAAVNQEQETDND